MKKSLLSIFVLSVSVGAFAATDPISDIQGSYSCAGTDQGAPGEMVIDGRARTLTLTRDGLTQTAQIVDQTSELSSNQKELGMVLFELIEGGNPIDMMAFLQTKNGKLLVMDQASPSDVLDIQPSAICTLNP